MQPIKRLSTLFILSIAVCAGAATLKGKVTTGTGAAAAPVEGVNVVLITTAGGGGGGGASQRIDSTLTDASGDYAFDSVATGTKQLQALKTGYQNGSGFANIATDTGNYTSNITLAVVGLPGKIIGTVRADSSTGAPIAGATVTLRRNGGGGGGGGAALDSVVTNAEGAYSFDSVASGNGYSVRAAADGFITGTVTANLASGATDTANLSLLRVGASGKVSGKVAKALDSTGLEGVTVTISTGGGAGGGATDTVTTNAKGEYSFDSVGVGANYTVRAILAEYTTGTNAGVSVALNKTTTSNFYLLPANAAGKVVGKITKAADGSAIADAEVVITRGGGGGAGGAFTPDTVMTNAQGAYAFDSIPVAANYTVSVIATGFQKAVNAAVSVAFNATSTADFALYPVSADTTRGTIAGRVEDADHKPLAKVKVLLSRGNGAAAGLDSMETDADGKFAFDTVSSVGGTYRLTCSLTGYRTGTSNTVRVTAGQTTVLNFTLAPATGIRNSGLVSARHMNLITTPNGFRIEFSASNKTGILTGYDIRGLRVLSMEVPAGATSLVLPDTHKTGYLIFSREGKTETKVLPGSF